MTLQELVDFCHTYDIDSRAVTFSYGHKEVMACFPLESIPCFTGMSLDDALEQADADNYLEYPILQKLYYSWDYEAFVKNIF